MTISTRNENHHQKDNHHDDHCTDDHERDHDEDHDDDHHKDEDKDDNVDAVDSHPAAATARKITEGGNTGDLEKTHVTRLFRSRQMLPANQTIHCHYQLHAEVQTVDDDR